jgi:hypothetical protein
MKRILVTFLCMFAVQANAEWGDSDITDIVNNVKAVKSKTVDGSIGISADDLKRQLDKLKSDGILIRSSVEEMLVWLEHRRGPFLQFKGNNCGIGSPCADFRGRLKQFAGEMSALAARFPAVEKVGLGDGDFSERVIEILPPFMLFGFHQVMEKVPGWEDIPLDLLDVYDEIADPEAFAISFAEPSSARQAASATQATAAQDTPTQSFCRERADRVDNATDSIRLNRIKSAGFALKTAVDVWSEFAPDDVGGSLVGEGVYGIPIFAKPIVKAIKGAIEIIQFQIETYRQNLGVCRNRLREIETHLVQCIEFAEYKQQPANDEAYALVERKVEEFEAASGQPPSQPQRGWGRPPPSARAYLERAAIHRGSQQWGAAYSDLCRAYQTLGT